MGLLGGCVSSVWLIHDVKLAKQIQLGLQLLPGASGDVLEMLNIDGNIDATFFHLQRWTHLLKVITNAKHVACPFILLRRCCAVIKRVKQRFCKCTGGLFRLWKMHDLISLIFSFYVLWSWDLITLSLLVEMIYHNVLLFCNNIYKNKGGGVCC